MTRDTRIIDASLRFLRSNPQLLAYAQSAAPLTGRSVDDLLLDALSRYQSGIEAISEQEVVTRASG